MRRVVRFKGIPASIRELTNTPIGTRSVYRVGTRFRASSESSMVAEATGRLRQHPLRSYSLERGRFVLEINARGTTPFNDATRVSSRRKRKRNFVTPRFSGSSTAEDNVAELMFAAQTISALAAYRSTQET